MEQIIKYLKVYLRESESYYSLINFKRLGVFNKEGEQVYKQNEKFIKQNRPFLNEVVNLVNDIQKQEHLNFLLQEELKKDIYKK